MNGKTDSSLQGLIARKINIGCQTVWRVFIFGGKK